MKDFLSRMAQRALRPPEILPRLPTRFETPDPGPARLERAEDWIEAETPRGEPTRPSRTPRPPAGEETTGRITGIERPQGEPTAQREPVHEDNPAPRLESLSPLEPRVDIRNPSSAPTAAPAVSPPSPELRAAPPADLPEPPESLEPSAYAESPLDPPRIETLSFFRLDAPVPAVFTSPNAVTASPSSRRPNGPRRAAPVPPQAEPWFNEASPLVEISIGRIEVKTAAPVAAPPPPPAAPRATPLSLEDYLRSSRSRS